MTQSNNTNDALSAVTVYFKDHFGQPIQNLKVEIKGLESKVEHVYHSASTNAQGSIAFSAHRGDALSVYVQRWTSESMKEIARLNASLPQIKFHLTSPKTLHDLPTKTDNSAGGNYWRGTYKVKKHDNLTVIARKYHTSVDLLKHLNNLKSDLIKVGQVIKVPPVQSRKSDVPAPKKPSPKGTPPTNNPDTNQNGAPTTTPSVGAAPIIFPVKVRPLNDEGGIYGTSACNYIWNKPLGSPGHQTPRFGAIRDAAGRKHAARDLYLENHTEIVAVAAGVVIKCEPFYCKTNQISIHHTTTDGRQFIALYGEVAPESIRVSVGSSVNQGDVLAKSGVLLHPNNTPLHIVGNQNVSMLHFEAYSGQGGFSPNSTINSSTLPGPFHRRSDLIDSLAILQEGYHATFLDAPALTPVGDRIPISQLELSDRGKDFVRCWESVKYDSSKQNTYYYNDSNGFCTVGWGSLVDRKSCASLGFTENVSKISVEEAQSLFEKDIAKNGGYVKDAIKVPLYQHEFDALVSLAFNVGHISIVAPKLCQKINNCDYTGAPVEFLDMEIPKRRQREHDMFCNGTYDASH